MLNKVNSKSRLAITLLLIGVFVAGGFLLQSAISDAPVPSVDITVTGPITSSAGYSANWDILDESPYVWVSATRYDTDGNVIGNLSLGGSRSPIFDEDDDDVVVEVRYSVDASATGARGKANAWVIAPGNGREHDQMGVGSHPVNWNDPDLPGGMYASDTSVRNVHGVGQRTMEASGSLRDGGEPTVSVKFTVSGI